MSLYKDNPREYNSVHQWVKRHMTKTGICNICGKPNKTQWSNKTGMYMRNISDWQELCAYCHTQYDDRNLRHQPFPDWFVETIKKARKQKEDGIPGTEPADLKSLKEYINKNK